MRVPGLSLARLNDLALLTVDPAASDATASDQHKWRDVASLTYPLADRPPPANTPAVITSYPLLKDGRFGKITYFGTFIDRERRRRKSDALH